MIFERAAAATTSASKQRYCDIFLTLSVWKWEEFSSAFQLCQYIKKGVKMTYISLRWSIRQSIHSSVCLAVCPSICLSSGLHLACPSSVYLQSTTTQSSAKNMFYNKTKIYKITSCLCSCCFCIMPYYNFMLL